MMKRILLTILTVLAAACTSEKTGDNPSILVTHSSLSFSYRPSQTAITVKAESSWVVNSDSPWLTTSISGEERSATFAVSVTENGGEPREGTLTISDGLSECCVRVHQDADTRNYLDIRLENAPQSFERLLDANLVIPYRNGGGVTLKTVSASVAGDARGSITVRPLKDVTLETGEGEIRLSVSGRCGAAGLLLFTVSGLPATVYGDAAQCMLEITEGEAISDISVSELKSLPDGIIGKKSRTRVVVTSVSGDGFTVQDAGGGVRMTMPAGEELPSAGDECEIFVKGNTVSTENTLRVVALGGKDDVAIVERGVAVEPLEVTGLDLGANQSMLCLVQGCQARESELSRPSVYGVTLMECRGWTFNILADFEAPLPGGYGNVIGVLGTDGNGKPVLKPRDAGDLAGLSGERIDVNAVFELSVSAIKDIPAAGADNITFSILSSVDWTLVSDDGGWLRDWSRKSGSASAEPVQVRVNASPNTLGRRTATVTISGKNVPDLILKITQKEGKTILDQDFSLVRESLKGNPKYYPTGSSTEISKDFSSYGLDGWYSSSCYTSLSKDGQYGMLRIGKTLVKGYLQTPFLTEIGDIPTNIEVSLLGGKYKSCVPDWFAVELDGPGVLVAGEDLVMLEAYDGKYKSAYIDNLPVYLLTGFTNAEERRVKFRIEGATSATRIRFTATTKGSGSAADCNLFFIGDIHVNYAD